MRTRQEQETENRTLRERPSRLFEASWNISQSVEMEAVLHGVASSRRESRRIRWREKRKWDEQMKRGRRDFRRIYKKGTMCSDAAPPLVFSGIVCNCLTVWITTNWNARSQPRIVGSRRSINWRYSPV